jgi:flavin-dependent dehydrogenase
VIKLGLGPIKEGGRVVVVGGGPGGTAAAIALKLGAHALGRNLIVTIVEGKQFINEQHYNQCSGVLAPPIVDLFEKRLHVPFPHHLCRNTISGYELHTPKRKILLEGEEMPSLSLRRIQFDDYMLSLVREMGIEVVQARATGVEVHDSHALIYTENAPLKADVVVGAFGMDEGAGQVFRQAIGYRPPPAICSIITKVHPGESVMGRLGKHIYAFLPSSRRIEFGAVTPKGNHLTINIAGERANSEDMDRFLSSSFLRRSFPWLGKLGGAGPQEWRFYRGVFPSSTARNFSADRCVMVGDAAGLVRAFKGKGVTAAILTGIRAADVILKTGISAEAFKSYHTANQDITNDLPYGKAMRSLTSFASAYGLMDAVLLAAENNPHLRRALFNAVSAHGPYREVVLAAFSPGSILSIVGAYLKLSSRK